MTHTHPTTTRNRPADPGLYVDLMGRRLHRLDEPGSLPGSPDSWKKVPAALQLAAAPLVGLAFVIFLPWVGFVLLFGVMLEAAGRVLAPVGSAIVRVMRPTWQPALAFLARRRRARGTPDPDAWSDGVRREIDGDDSDH